MEMKQLKVQSQEVVGYSEGFCLLEYYMKYELKLQEVLNFGIMKLYFSFQIIGSYGGCLSEGGVGLGMVVKFDFSECFSCFKRVWNFYQGRERQKYGKV